MAQANVFPAFISVGLDNSSSGFGDFRSAAADAGGAVKRQFDNDMAEVKRTIVNALTLPPNAFGALDLNTAGMRKAAAEAQAAAVATRQFADAAEAAARSSGDLSAQTRTFVTAARAEAVAAEEKARSLAANANAYEKLQVEMDRAAVSSGRLTNEMQSAVTANGRLAASQGALRQASIGTGQQLQDIAISLYSGQRAGVVFAQQLPQMAFALSALEGSANKTANRVGQFATFLSGPWGLAVGLGVGALATLTAGLFDNAAATDAVEDAHKELEKSLSDISSVFDLATGAINRQNEALIANARLKRLDERDDLRKAISSNQERGRSLVEGSMRGDVTFGGTFGNETGRANIVRSGPSDLVAAIRSANGDQNKMGAELVKLARGQGENSTRARALLDLMGEDANNRNRLRELSLEEESLRTGKLASELMQPKKTPGSGRGNAGKELRAAQAIEDAVNKASDAVAGLRGQFDDAPKDIDKAAAAMRELDVWITKLDRREASGKLTDAEKQKDAETRREIEKLQTETIPTFKQRPIEDRIKAGERELELQRLVLSGREDEADILSFQYDVMQQMNVQSEDQLRKELEGRGIGWDRYQLLVKQRDEMTAMQRAQERLDRAGRSVASQLREIDGIRGSIEQAIARAPGDAAGAVKDLVGNIKSQFRAFSARQLADQLFGNVFEDLENELRSKSPIGRASREFVEGSDKATDAMSQLTQGFDALNASLPRAVNDNQTGRARSLYDVVDSTDIVVSGSRSRSRGSPTTTPTGLSAEELYETTFTRLFERYLGKGAPLARDLGSIFQGYLQAGPLGGGINSLAAIFGESSGVGKALQSLSKAMPQIGMIMQAQSAIGSLLGNDEIKNGKLLNHLIGPFATALFGSAKRGSATIGGVGDDFSVAVRGNTGKYRKASGAAADSVIDSIADIADRLGGYVDASRGSVSIGIRKGNYRVDPNGQGRTKAKNGVIDFGDDAEAAARAAMLDLINDGVIQGLKAGTQRLIRAGKDLDVQLQKALDFESVFTRLKEYRDPVGAALDTLDKEFTRLQKIFAEAGASTAEYAELEALYGLERTKAIEEAANRATASLKSLFDDLTIGENGRSLRDRMGAAQAAYDPLKARVLAGDRTAYDAFAEAAKSLLDIQRQFSGSQTPYFELLDEITKITKDRIDAESNITSIAENRDSPFGSNGKVTGANDNAPVVGAIQEGNELLRQIGRLLAGGGSGGGISATGFLTNSFL